MGTALCFGFVCIWHGASTAVVQPFLVISRFSNGLNCYCYLGDLVCVKLLWHLSGNNGQIFLYLLAYCKLESTDLNGADVHAM